MAMENPPYQAALGSYQWMLADPYAKMMSQLTPALQQMMSYYAPGGGYGQGQRTEAAETVKGGLGQDIGQMVASGMSGQFGARGAGTRAGTQLSTLYKNIEDTRANLWQQSVQPYAQIMQAMASIYGQKPTTGQYGASSQFRPDTYQPGSYQIDPYQGIRHDPYFMGYV